MIPTLYCLMRDDLQDMNPGKAMAQAMHAQSDFDEWVSRLTVPNQYLTYIAEWKENRSFGRTLVLECGLDKMAEITMMENGYLSHPMGMTVDPTYPWRNFYGKVFLTEEVTCAWVFACEVTSPRIIEELKKLSLHR